MYTRAKPNLLLVEDHALLLHDMAAVLANAGFEVAGFAEGASALAELDRMALKYAALITDIRLGSGMTGWDLANTARQLSPRMPIAYVTADSAAGEAALKVTDSLVLYKPCTDASLVLAINNLLESATAPAPDCWRSLGVPEVLRSTRSH